MRIKSATIEGFRGFARRTSVDLDASVVILQGPNGVGKTSLLDAILWALTGQIGRFSSGSPVSLYSLEGVARVEVSLEDRGQNLLLSRSTDGSRKTFILVDGERRLEGTEAEVELSSRLLPNAPSDENGLSNIFTRGIYLQQDMVRQFVETDSAAARFELISQAIGAGVILELQEYLERARYQWSRTMTSTRRDELEPALLRLEQLDVELTQLAAAGGSQVDARAISGALYSDAIQLVGRLRLAVAEAPTTASGLDRLLKEIGAERSAVERELGTLQSLAEQARESSSSSASQEQTSLASERVVKELEQQLRDANLSVESAIRDLGRRQQEFLTQRSRVARLANLARLAMDEIDGPCPVCQQTHDKETTRRHLDALIAASEEPAPTASDAQVLELTSRRNDLAARLETARQALQREDAARREIASQREIFMARLRDQGIADPTTAAAELEALISSKTTRLEDLTNLLRKGEALALDVVRMQEQRRRGEAQSQRARTSKEVEALKVTLARMERTHTVAGQIIDGLRQASLDITADQIARLSPLFQRIYSRIDPHPTFRVTQLATSLMRGKGLLNPGILDPDQGTKMYDAVPLLSSSQLNSYAVSLFLAINLTLSSLKLDVTMLDDPLQSLDSVNLLGVVDVLRRVREHRQVFVSTHEQRFLGLLQRKLRPRRPGERLVTLVFEGWSREGPALKTIESVYDENENTVLAA